MLQCSKIRGIAFRLGGISPSCGSSSRLAASGSTASTGLAWALRLAGQPVSQTDSVDFDRIRMVSAPDPDRRKNREEIHGRRSRRVARKCLGEAGGSRLKIVIVAPAAVIPAAPVWHARPCFHRGIPAPVEAALPPALGLLALLLIPAAKALLLILALR